MSGLGSRLKARRHELGFSLRDVEEITKGRISNARLSQLENGGGNPSLGTAIELAACYGLPMETLAEWLGLATDTPPPTLCPTCGRAMTSPRFTGQPT